MSLLAGLAGGAIGWHAGGGKGAAIGAAAAFLGTGLIEAFLPSPDPDRSLFGNIATGALASAPFIAAGMALAPAFFHGGVLPTLAENVVSKWLPGAISSVHKKLRGTFVGKVASKIGTYYKKGLKDNKGELVKAWWTRQYPDPDPNAPAILQDLQRRRQEYGRKRKNSFSPGGEGFSTFWANTPDIVQRLLWTPNTFKLMQAKKMSVPNLYTAHRELLAEAVIKDAKDKIATAALVGTAYGIGTHIFGDKKEEMGRFKYRNPVVPGMSGMDQTYMGGTFSSLPLNPI